MALKFTGRYDHDAECTETNASVLGTVVKSIDEILGDKDITAVVVSSETVYHCELVEKAAEGLVKIIMFL